ncbi:MAG: PQQ-binding-like beta-propeller repeat protein [Opitutaceae bacterium]
MIYPRRTLFVLLPLLSVSLPASGDGTWPQFRGPGASGIAQGEPPLRIGPGEPHRWKVSVPWSPSSPVVWGDSIFLTTFDDGELQVRAYARSDGAVRWKRGVRPTALEEHHRADGSPAASSPATDGRHVVSYFGYLGVICHDVDGRELWRRPMPVAESGGKFGTGTSPVIRGTRVLLNRDVYQGSALLCLDLASGRTLWETPRPEAAGSFGTPVIWNAAGVDEVVVAGTAQLKGYDLRNGEERWVVRGVAGVVCTTPVTGDGLLFFAAWSPGQADAPRQPWEEFLRRNDKNGDGVVDLEEIDASRRDYLRGLDRNRDGKFTKEDWDILKEGDARAENVLVAIRPGGRGEISETHVAWKYRRALPYVPSPLHHDGRLYFVRDGGQLSCLDARTGEPVYAQEKLGPTGNYYASPVVAAGRLYFASLAGKLTVVRSGGTKPEILHQADFGARILATPAPVGDRLYVRTATDLWAF